MVESEKLFVAVDISLKLKNDMSTFLSANSLVLLMSPGMSPFQIPLLPCLPLNQKIQMNPMHMNASKLAMTGSTISRMFIFLTLPLNLLIRI
uniref:Uncharacterized protein n=1 Tax=Arundo donax TaxID=35708 RepID=A0A0A9D713_ARUDO